MDEAVFISRIEDVACYGDMILGDNNAMVRLALAEEIHSRGIRKRLIAFTCHCADSNFIADVGPVFRRGIRPAIRRICKLEPKRVEEPARLMASSIRKCERTSNC